MARLCRIKIGAFVQLKQERNNWMPLPKGKSGLHDTEVFAFVGRLIDHNSRTKDQAKLGEAFDDYRKQTDWKTAYDTYRLN
jgi:hypothetical protein